jgi:peptide/nickel transport system substrate-binding protein
MEKNRTTVVEFRMDRRRFLHLSSLVGAGAASGLLWGCAPTAPGATTPAATAEVTTSESATGSVGELILVQGVDAESLDPYVTTSGASKGMMWAMYDKLVERDVDMNMIPWLAESWSSPDDTTWELKLRDEVYFHNGEKFSGDHVRDSIARFKDPSVKNIYAGQLEKVTEVVVVDPLTVQIKTDGPFALLMEVLAVYCEIMPAAITSGEVDPAQKAIGSGPYKFVEWTPGDRMVMEAADKPHFSGQPKLKSLVWRPVAEATTRVVELKTGQAHIITNVDPVQRQEVEDDPATKVLTYRDLSSQCIVLNSLKVEAFKDVHVRQALNYATDVDTLIKTIMQGNAYRLAGALGPGLPGHDPDLKPYPYDPDKARQLLADAGYADGFDVVLVSPNGRYLNDTLASEAIAGMWTEVGVRTTVNVMDWSPFVEGVIGNGPAGKSLDAFFFLQLGVPLDAGVSTNFHAGRKGAAWQGYSNDEVSQIIDEAVTVLDADKRNEMYKRMGQILYEECPWVFLWNPQGLVGVREEVQNWQPHPDGTLHLFDVSLAA